MQYKLINNLLFLAKAENTNNNVKKEKFNLSEEINMVVAMFESMAYEKKVKIKSKVAENIDFIGNKEDIKHVVSVLIDNAIKHTKEDGEVILELEKEKGKIDVNCKDGYTTFKVIFWWKNMLQKKMTSSTIRKNKGGKSMEAIEKILKKTGWSSLITSVIFAIIGSILIAKPEGTVKIASYIIGIIFIFAGIYKIFNYLREKENTELLYHYNVAYGVIAIIIGLITMFYSTQIVALFRILIGIWIIYSSILRINLAFNLKNIDSKLWIPSIIVAFAMFVCGIYITFTSNAIIVTIGIIIVTYAVLDIIESLIFLGNIKKLSIK